jgi:putative ATPase
MRGRVFYTPGKLGYEAGIHDDVLRRREARLEAVLEAPEEVFSYSPGNRTQEEWLSRAGSGRGKVLEALRDKIFTLAEIRRHHRVLAVDSGSGLLVWEALRKAPEGGVWAVLPKKRDYDIVSSYIESLPEIERPVVIHAALAGGGLTPRGENGEQAKDLPPFEIALGRNVLAAAAGWEESVRGCAGLLAPGGRLVVAETAAALGARFFTAAGSSGLSAALREKLLAAEDRMYAANPSLNWKPADLEKAAARAGFADTRLISEYYDEERLVSPANIAAWFGPLFSGEPGEADEASGASGYAALLGPLLSAGERQEFRAWLESAVKGKVIPWKSCVVFLTGVRGGKQD